MFVLRRWIARRRWVAACRQRKGSDQNKNDWEAFSHIDQPDMELWMTLQAKGLKGRLRPPSQAELKALSIR